MNEIVAGVDGSPGSLAAVRWAADRASRGSAGLRLVCAVPRWAEDMPEWGPHAGVGRWARRDADDTLATAARVAREVAPRLDVTTRRRGGEAAGCLVEAATGAAMIVVGACGCGGYLDLALGSVADRVAGTSPVPVVVVREGTDGEVDRLRDPYDGVVVALDPASGVIEAAEVAAVEFAAEEAALRASRLCLISALAEWSGLRRAPEVPDAEEFLAERAADLEHRLAGLLDAWSDRLGEIPASAEARRGHPVEVLLAAARRAELLVVGRNQRSGRRGIGPVARSVLHRAACSVAVVPPRH